MRWQVAHWIKAGDGAETERLGTVEADEYDPERWDGQG